jgi:hypothetical protein
MNDILFGFERREVIKVMKMTKVERRFKSLCQIVVGIKTYPGSLINYGKAYAYEGLDMSSNEMIEVQIRYILSNLHGWRGDDARRTKKEFKKLLKDIK